MNIAQLRNKVRQWDLIHSGNSVAKAKYGQILDQIEYHARRGWKVYLPAEHPDYSSSYMNRLAAWIGNVGTDEDQKLLLEYALMISFFSHDDFSALYRTAMDREVTRWVASQTNARLESNSLQQFSDQLRFEVKSRTWYCPITDSMDINEFCKINHLTGVSQHPTFSGLQLQAADPAQPDMQVAHFWQRYMRNPSQNPDRKLPSLSRLVLLEDIVGSASQCEEAIIWAVRALEVPVLFIPLILCPNGVEKLRSLEKAFEGRLTVRPVVELQRSDLLGPERKGEPGWQIAALLENLIDRHHPSIDPSVNAYGYRGTGCSLATFKNCAPHVILAHLAT